METSDNETTVYVIINGAFLTGKSGLASYLIGKPQKPKHGTISSDWIPVDYNFHGQQIRVFILDTNGFEIKNTLRSLMQNQCKAIILTYDVCNITSFKELDTRFQIYSHDISKRWVKILVANSIRSYGFPLVSREEGEEKAKLYGMHYFETNLLTGEGTKELLDQIVLLAFANKEKALKKHEICVIQ